MKDSQNKKYNRKLEMQPIKKLKVIKQSQIKPVEQPEEKDSICTSDSQSINDLPKIISEEDLKLKERGSKQSNLN